MKTRWILQLVTTVVIMYGFQAMAAGLTLSSPQLAPGATMADAQVFNGFG